jgi:hypothetical protein
MSNTDNLIIRNMTRKDMDTIMIWAKEENWNPGIADADNFYNTDPEGFFIAEFEGRPVSCVSVVRYGHSFGFLGMYLARKEYKGKGFGLKVFNAGMNFLKGRNVGLDGVMAQEENYKKSGFKTAYYNLRYGGALIGDLSTDIIKATDIPFEKLVEYDSRHFLTERSKFLEGWIKAPNIGLAIMNNDKIAGYGVIRPMQTGFRIGPLFADNTDIAEKILLSMASYTTGASISLDIPEVNPDSLELFEKYNFKQIYKTARMYTGEFPALPFKEIYALTSLALG